MKINGLALLHDFVRQYPKAKNWIENWIADTRSASWQTPHDVRARYATCSFLASNVVVFNVCGNNYRMETVVAYGAQVVVVRRIETHAEYTRRLK
jgi:mRNA interferase HigB